MKNAEATPRPPAWSLANRLTRHYVLSAVIILGLAVFTLHWTLERSLDARDRAQVLSKVQVLQTLLREHFDKPEILISEIEHEAAENQALRYYLRILDAQGVTLMETTGMRQVLPPSIFPPAAPVAITRFAGGSGALFEHQTFLLASVEAIAGGGPSRKRSLQVGLELTPTIVLIESYHRVLLAVLVGGAALMGLAGWVIARRGVRPLWDLADATRRVTASRLSERVSGQQWPAELGHLAGAFDEMLVRLEDSFRRLTDFSSDLAHALRNPINNLRGEAEVALARARSTEEYQQVLASSLEELERLSRMIDGLLFLARSDDARVAIQRVTLKARRELEAVREFYDAVATEGKVTLRCEGEAAFQGDPMLVRRAVSNLVGNALKHTPPGGNVVVTAREEEGGGAEISVRDDGAGIPAELLPRVFERFFQVDKSRDLTAKGAGLGLAIVQSIMRLHGGEARVESVLGRGTTVTLRFPGSRHPVS
ncbi:MAG: heavy metal sensor histidine kinase [Verrucomicrobia bacterium]|nr:heavy metal sensor histidine kinase [Verrucomicrobiota bacterium]